MNEVMEVMEVMEVLKDRLNRKIVAWSATILWMVIIFLFSAQPHSGAITEAYLGDANVPVRKVAHVTEFCILFFLFHWSFWLSLKNQNRAEWPLILSFAATALYAMSDEWHQSFVPGRSAGVNDVLVDLFGVALGVLIVIVWRRLRTRVPSKSQS